MENTQNLLKGAVECRTPLLFCKWQYVLWAVNSTLVQGHKLFYVRFSF